MGGCLSVPGGSSNHVNAEGTAAGTSGPTRESRRRKSSGASTSGALEGLPKRRASTANQPARLALKGKKLATTLNEARSEGLSGPLVNLAEHTLQELAANRQPGPEMTRLDIASLPALARAYNQRYDGLDLRVIDRPSQLIDALTTLEPGKSLRAIVRLYDDRKHHFVADVRGHASDETTVVVLEPARVLLEGQLPGYVSLREQSNKRLGDRSKWSFVDIGAQYSFNDCLAFSMHTALCAFQDSELLDNWHDQLHTTGMLGGADEESRNFRPVPLRYLIDAGLNVLEGRNFLPFAFFKHTHSTDNVTELETLRPDARSTNVRPGNRSSASESISARQAAFGVNREDARYSASIEGSRATKVRVALEAELRSLRGE